MNKTEIKRYQTQGFEVIYSYTIDQYENPNTVFGIWTPADYHEAGQTVQDCQAERGCPKFYTSCNYTPAELAKEYAKQGRKNPSKEAYNSLQNELLHYLYGFCFYAEIEIKRAGIWLAGDWISSDYSDWAFPTTSLETEAERIAKEYFSIKDLIQRAKVEAGKKALQLI